METFGIILKHQQRHISALECAISRLTDCSKVSLKCWKRQKALNRLEIAGFLALTVLVVEQKNRLDRLEEKVASAEIADEDKEE